MPAPTFFGTSNSSPAAVKRSVFDGICQALCNSLDAHIQAGDFSKDNSFYGDLQQHLTVHKTESSEKYHVSLEYMRGTIDNAFASLRSSFQLSEGEDRMLTLFHKQLFQMEGVMERHLRYEAQQECQYRQGSTSTSNQNKSTIASI